MNQPDPKITAINDDWRRPFNRLGQWWEPPAPAAPYVVSPAPHDGWTHNDFMNAYDEFRQLCYRVTASRYWCYVRYRLRDGRWLMCRSNTSSLSKSKPKFAVATHPEDRDIVYKAFDEFDWTTLSKHE